MRALFFVAVAAALVALGSMSTWVVARILLPAAGLSVPDYGKFFWAAVILTGFGICCGVIQAVAKAYLD